MRSRCWAISSWSWPTGSATTMSARWGRCWRRWCRGRSSGRRGSRNVGTSISGRRGRRWPSSLKGPKQKAIVAALRERGAFTADAAVEVAELLETVGCGQPAVKHLADGQIVRVVQKKVFANLPVVPEGMLVEAAQQITPQRRSAAGAGADSAADRVGAVRRHAAARRDR